jgi:hypothetical protein
LGRACSSFGKLLLEGFKKLIIRGANIAAKKLTTPVPIGTIGREKFTKSQVSNGTMAIDNILNLENDATIIATEQSCQLIATFYWALDMQVKNRY